MNMALALANNNLHGSVRCDPTPFWSPTVLCEYVLTCGYKEIQKIFLETLVRGNILGLNEWKYILNTFFFKPQRLTVIWKECAFCN